MLDSWSEEGVPDEETEWQDYTDSAEQTADEETVRRPEISGGSLARVLRPGEARVKKQDSGSGEWKSYFDQFSDEIDERKGQVGRDARLGAAVVLGRWTAFIHGTTAVALAAPAMVIGFGTILYTGLLSAQPTDGTSILTIWGMATLTIIIMINGLSFGLAHAVGRAVTGLGRLSREAPTLGISARFSLVPTIGLAAPAALSTLLLTLGLYIHGVSLATFDVTVVQTGQNIHATLLMLLGVFGVLMSFVGMVPLLVRDIILAED